MPDGLIVGLPSAASVAFWSWSAWRTPGRPAAEELVGDRLLLLGERRPSRPAGGRGPASGAWAWAAAGPRAPARTTAARGVPAAGGRSRPHLRGAGRGMTSRLPGRGRSPLGRRSPAGPTVARRAPIASARVPAVPPVATVAVVPGPLADQAGRHGLELGATEDLDALRLLAVRARRHDRVDLDPVEGDGGLDLEDVADLGPVGQDRRLDHAPGFPGAGGAPRPRPVRARARELDVDPARHGNRNLPAGRSACETAFASRRTSAPTGATPPRYRRLVPIYALGDDTPEIHPDAFVHPDAVVIGAVRIGADEHDLARTRCCGATAAGASRSAPTPRCRTARSCTRRPSTRPSSATAARSATSSTSRAAPSRTACSSARARSSSTASSSTAAPSWPPTPSCSTAPTSRRARSPSARRPRIKPGRARPEEIERGREVYVAKGREYREGLRRIG